ncbi:hypothetical protein BBJ28_00021880 [Nothophytophthora sp. Chile5]|nr:hypothetical protein BBJ28_00021880 [Nothophytophthora sp. Chile5]
MRMLRMLQSSSSLLLLAPGRHALQAAASSASAASQSSGVSVFESLALENGRVLPQPLVTRRVFEYLGVAVKDPPRVLSNKALFAPALVHKLTPLARWSFQQYGAESERQAAAGAVFAALQPHSNMAKSMVWRQYFLRQFFLSGAPLRSYLRALKIHRDVTAVASAASTKEEAEEEDKADDDELEGSEDAEPVAASAPTKSKRGQKKRHQTEEKFTVLSESDEWEWVPLYVATGIVKEFCLRGRFAEAIEAYASLPLTDAVRQDIVQLLQDYEQFPTVLYLYEVHRAIGTNVEPLDVAPELNALKKLGRLEEMNVRFQELPVKQQGRADVQKLMED